MIARYPGRCARTGQPVHPGDRVEWDPVARTVTLAPPDPADTLDQHMPRTPRGRSRAQVWRSLQNARYGADLDHEVE